MTGFDSVALAVVGIACTFAGIAITFAVMWPLVMRRPQSETLAEPAPPPRRDLEAAARRIH